MKIIKKFETVVAVVSVIIALMYLLYVFCFGFDAQYVDVGWFRVAVLWVIAVLMIICSD